MVVVHELAGAGGEQHSDHARVSVVRSLVQRGPPAAVLGWCASPADSQGTVNTRRCAARPATPCAAGGARPRRCGRSARRNAVQSSCSTRRWGPALHSRPTAGANKSMRLPAVVLGVQRGLPLKEKFDRLGVAVDRRAVQRRIAIPGTEYGQTRKRPQPAHTTELEEAREAERSVLAQANSPV